MQSFDFERIWWRLFQKHVVYTKLDIYCFIECTVTVIVWNLVFLEKIQGRNYIFTNQLLLERRFLCDVSTCQTEALEQHNLKDQIV